MEGMRKARVLPEPVRAAPSTSLPVRRTGMDFAWTGVIVVRPISERAREVGSERSRVEKGSRPDSVLEDEETSFIGSGLKDVFESLAWDVSFLLFLFDIAVG